MAVTGAIQQVLVEAGAEATTTASRLVRWAEQHGVAVALAPPPTGEDTELAVEHSKLAVRVARHAGAALRFCTGRTDSLLCCNLRVLMQTVGCPLDCSYCILQSYQNRGEIVVRADPQDLLLAVAQDLAEQPRRLFRVCTGQVADSLALEPEVGFAAEAVESFAGLSNAVLELKTKTSRVDFLLDLAHRGRTIVSWSLNPAEVVDREEGLAAPLEERLAAAARVARAGYLVAFHLDPMVTVDGDPAPFCALVNRALAMVPPTRVAYLSLGTVRFPPFMRRTVSSRFPASRAPLAELLPDIDGKLRLLAPLRIALYRAVAAEVRRHSSEIFLYLCMEPVHIWRRALGLAYGSAAEVELALAASLHQRFGLAPCTPCAADYPDPG